MRHTFNVLNYSDAELWQIADEQRSHEDGNLAMARECEEELKLRLSLTQEVQA